ncbi:Uncharacterised protein r2_g2773 [Pycnogonum litorale]
MEHVNGSTYEEHRVSTTDSLKRWLETARGDNFESFVDLIVSEQLINTLSEEMRCYVRQREQNNSKEIARICDVYRISMKQESGIKVQLNLSIYLNLNTYKDECLSVCVSVCPR